jgi:hypothetical protein
VIRIFAKNELHTNRPLLDEGVRRKGSEHLEMRCKSPAP